jgi:hypothetical protein
LAGIVLVLAVELLDACTQDTAKITAKHKKKKKLRILYFSAARKKSIATPIFGLKINSVRLCNVFIFDDYMQYL